MRIYKRPKFPKMVCRSCGCVFRPGHKDIKWHHYGELLKDDLYVTCPGCGKHITPWFNFKNRIQHDEDYWEQVIYPALHDKKNKGKPVIIRFARRGDVT